VRDIPIFLTCFINKCEQELRTGKLSQQKIYNHITIVIFISYYQLQHKQCCQYCHTMPSKMKTEIQTRFISDAFHAAVISLQLGPDLPDMKQCNIDTHTMQYFHSLLEVVTNSQRNSTCNQHYSIKLSATKERTCGRGFQRRRSGLNE